MMNYYSKPHSPEWFAALKVMNPSQAAHTRSLVETAGRNDICSVCGDSPAEELRIVGGDTPALSSIRLCQDCRTIRAATLGESYEEFG